VIFSINQSINQSIVIWQQESWSLYGSGPTTFSDIHSWYKYCSTDKNGIDKAPLTCHSFAIGLPHQDAFNGAINNQIKKGLLLSVWVIFCNR